jgi:hypothetical protein
VLAADIPRLRTRFMFSQDRNDPFFREPRLLHLRLPQGDGLYPFLEEVQGSGHSQHIPAERFQHLFTLDGADPEGPGDHLRGEFFVAYDVPTDALVITEGKLLIVLPDAIWKMQSKLTPTTLLAVNAFMSRQISPAGR